MLAMCIKFIKGVMFILSSILSGGIGYLFGKVWGMIGFVIKSHQERLDKQIEMSHQIKMKEKEMELEQMRAQNALDIETVRANMSIAVETAKADVSIKLSQDELRKATNTLEADLDKVEAKDQEEIRQGEDETLAKISGIFRVLIGGIATIYVYTIGFTAFFVSLKLHKIVMLIAEIHSQLNMPSANTEMIVIMEEYLRFPMEIINQVFHSGLMVITFYFGAMHAHTKLHDKEKK